MALMKGEFDWAVRPEGIFLILNDSHFPLAGFKIIPSDDRKRDEDTTRMEISDPLLDIVIFKFSMRLPAPFSSDEFFMELSDEVRAFTDMLQARYAMKAMNA